MIDTELVLKNPVIDDTVKPFDQADITLVEGEQGMGKTVTATALVIDSYYKDAVRIFLKKVFKINAIVLSFNYDNRVARVIVEDERQLIKVPHWYNLKSPIRIFSNYHLWGLPYVYCPTFQHILKWLRSGFISMGWLLIDEAQEGANARDSMTKLGKELNKTNFQMRKAMLKVVILTPNRSLIERNMRLVPTKWIGCTRSNIPGHVTLDIKKKGEKQTSTVTYDARAYYKFYWTNERRN